MSRKWYGSFNNRLEEGRQFVDEITVGTGVTEYFYSDRKAYEVVAVQDQKHITIRKLDHKLVGEAYSNDWELISNENNPTIDLVKRGNGWYVQNTVTKEMLETKKETAEDEFYFSLWLCHNGFDRGVIMEKGKQTKYRKMNISIGVADYYYDYAF